MNKSFLASLALGSLLAGCQAVTSVSYMYPNDVKMWDNIFENGKEYELLDETVGAILPHHMLVAFELSGFYKAWSEAADPSVVLVIGPNHYESGTSNVQTCLDCDYMTIGGSQSLARVQIQDLIETGLADRRDKTFEQEHAIFTHASYIDHFFPEAEMLPLLLNWEMPQSDLDALAVWLNANLPEDALVIASVDFSHYIPDDASQLHDLASLASIQNFDYENIYDLEVDSPSSVYLAMKLMETRNAQSATQYDRTSLQDFLDEPEDYGTSHQFIGFSEGPVSENTGVTLQFFGEGFEDYGFNKGWDWNRKNIDTFLENLSGDEDRFLTGVDFSVFKLEAGCQIEEQNHVRLAFCSLNSESRDFSFESLEEDVEHIIVEYSFSESFSVENARLLAHGMIDQGVDVFIGRGLDVTPVEHYEESTMILSLGRSMSLGMYLNGAEQRLFPFPLQFIDGKPELLGHPGRGAEASLFLTK